MPIVTGEPVVFAQAWEDLHQAAEQVGFFLADYDNATGAFHLLEWRLVRSEGFDTFGPLHVTLSDEVQTGVIQWAFSSGRCLVEAHSHGPRWPAEFSSTDLLGLDEWVPHVRWRLRARPYGALVVGGRDFDGLAWVEAAVTPVQITTLTAGAIDLTATMRTLQRGPLERPAGDE